MSGRRVKASREISTRAKRAEREFTRRVLAEIARQEDEAERADLERRRASRVALALVTLAGIVILGALLLGSVL